MQTVDASQPQVLTAASSWDGGKGSAAVEGDDFDDTVKGARAARANQDRAKAISELEEWWSRLIVCKHRWWKRLNNIDTIH